MSLQDNAQIRELIDLARREDLGTGDVTVGLLRDADKSAVFHLVVKQPCILAGREIAPLILEAYDPSMHLEWLTRAQDGSRVDSVPHAVAVLRGPLGAALSAERVLLNFLQKLCGVATTTRAFVDAVAGTGASVYDTRKTTPGWRVLEKYAVRCGGGRNHRQGLYDAVLIKDNHIAGVPADRLAAKVFEMLNQMSALPQPPAFVEVEAASMQQVRELCKVVGIHVILLDNFRLPELREAVQYRDDLGLRGKLELEASGGITLDNVRAVAETGVERISAGALTHSARAIDLSLDRA